MRNDRACIYSLQQPENRFIFKVLNPYSKKKYNTVLPYLELSAVQSLMAHSRTQVSVSRHAQSYPGWSVCLSVR